MGLRVDHLKEPDHLYAICLQVVRAVLWPNGAHGSHYVTASDDALVSLWYGAASVAASEQREVAGSARSKKRQRRI